jgi:cobalt/nickel transport system permease protein
MHIPDGFLTARVAAGAGLVAVLGLGAACARTKAAGERSPSALLGVSAAFVFAAQLVNFPVAAGTSGHLVGGALLAALVGLPGAVVVMSSVLLVQCFVFGDGGVLALGANVCNMALVSSVVGYAVYRVSCGKNPNPTRRVASVAFAAWCATVATAAACAEELALSGAARLSVVLPAMVGVHALIGVGEAVITALVVASVLRFRPELLERASPPHARSAVGYGLGASLVVALLLAPLASAAPDGLARVAERLGLHARPGSALAAPLADYAVPGLGVGALTTLLAGAFGMLLIFGLCWLLALVVMPRAQHAPQAADAGSPPVAAE